MASTGSVRIGDEDRATLLTWTRSSSVRAGLALRARIVLAAGRRRGHLSNRAPAGGVTADGDSLAGPLRRGWCGWSARRTAFRPAEDHRRQ